MIGHPGGPGGSGGALRRFFRERRANTDTTRTGTDNHSGAKVSRTMTESAGCVQSAVRRAVIKRIYIP